MKKRSILTMLIMSLILLTFIGCPPTYKELTPERLEKLIIHAQNDVKNIDSWNMWNEYHIFITGAIAEDGTYSKIYCEKVNSGADVLLQEYLKIDGERQIISTWYIDGMRYYEDRYENKFWEEAGDNEYETLADEIFPALQEAINNCFGEREFDMSIFSGYIMNISPILVVQPNAHIKVSGYGYISIFELYYTTLDSPWPGELRSIGVTMEDGTTIALYESDNIGFYDDMSSTRAQYETSDEDEPQ